jgi:hypothetical protein
MYNIYPQILCQPNILKPLHGLNPRSLLWQKWWDIQRKKAYERNDNHCLWCWVEKSKARLHKWLEWHENYHIDFDTCTYKLESIVPLCHFCHSFIHDWLLEIRHNKWEISTRTYNAIISHWTKILKDNDLDRWQRMLDLCWWDMSRRYPEKNWTWSSWWLEIDWVKYYTKFKDVYERAKFYN